jgi:hypothetical protein
MKTAVYFILGFVLHWLVGNWIPYGLMTFFAALIWAFFWKPTTWQQLLGSVLAPGLAWVLVLPLLTEPRALVFFAQLEQIVGGKSYAGYGWIGITFVLGGVYGLLGGWLGYRCRVLFWPQSRKTRGVAHPLIRR